MILKHKHNKGVVEVRDEFGKQLLESGLWVKPQAERSSRASAKTQAGEPKEV